MVSLYTDECGMTDVSVKTGKKSRIRLCHIQPLNLLQISLGGKPSQPIKQVQECSTICAPALADNINKVLTTQFLAEWLNNLLRNHSYEDKHLFEFLYRSIEHFAASTKGENNFHIFFLIKLTIYLGIHPDPTDWSRGKQFDLADGKFVAQTPLHGYYLTESDSINFINMLRTGYDSMHLWTMSRAERNATLDYIISYYRLHSIDIGELKSLDILRNL